MKSTESAILEALSRKKCADNAHYGSENPKMLGQMCAPCAEYDLRVLRAEIAEKDRELCEAQYLREGMALNARAESAEAAQAKDNLRIIELMAEIAEAKRGHEDQVYSLNNQVARIMRERDEARAGHAYRKKKVVALQAEVVRLTQFREMHNSRADAAEAEVEQLKNPVPCPHQAGVSHRASRCVFCERDEALRAYMAMEQRALNAEKANDEARAEVERADKRLLSRGDVPLREENAALRAEAVSAWDGMRQARNARDDARAENKRLRAEGGDCCDERKRLTERVKLAIQMARQEIEHGVWSGMDEFASAIIKALTDGGPETKPNGDIK